MMNERSIGSILSLLSIVINTIISISFVPILLSFLGISEFGIYQLIGSFISIFTILDFGITSATTRFYTESIVKNDILKQKSILGLSFILYLIIIIIMICVWYYLYININFYFDNFSEDELVHLKQTFVVLIINFIFFLPCNIFKSIITSHEKFIFLKLVELIQISIRPILVIIFVFFSPYALTVSLIHTFINILYGILLFIYCKNKFNISMSINKLNKDFYSRFLNLSLSLFLVTIVDQIFWKSNQVILGLTCNTTEVAIYSISATIFMTYMSLSGCISSVFFPKVTKMIVCNDSHNEISCFFTKIGRVQYLLLLLVLLGFIIFGKEFIKLWVGESFIKSYYIAVIIMIPFTIDLIQNIGLVIMQVRNTYMFRAKIYMITGIFNIIFSYIVSSVYEGIGCAIVTGLSIFISNGIIMNIYYYKIEGVDIIMFWKEIIKISFIIIPMYIISIFLENIYNENNIYNLFMKIILFSFMYIIIVYFKILNLEEKNNLINLFHRLKNIKYKI